MIILICPHWWLTYNFSLKYSNPLSPSHILRVASGQKIWKIKHLAHFSNSLSTFCLLFLLSGHILEAHIFSKIPIFEVLFFSESKAEIFHLVVDNGKFSRNTGKLARYHDDTRRFGFTLNFLWKESKPRNWKKNWNKRLDKYLQSFYVFSELYFWPVVSADCVITCMWSMETWSTQLVEDNLSF